MEKDLFVVYIDKIGENSDLQYEYEVYISNTPDVVWAENWAEQPASACEKLPPEENTYQKIIKIKSEYNFNLVQNNDCFSMQDCIDGIISLCWFANEYGEMIVNIKFGEKLSDFYKKIQGFCDVIE